MVHLTEQKIRFCIRCDKANGWTGIRPLFQSGQTKAIVPLLVDNYSNVQIHRTTSAALTTAKRDLQIQTLENQAATWAGKLDAQDGVPSSGARAV